MYACGFIGHRDASGIDEQIQNEINKLLSQNYSTFYSGGMGCFDKTCEKIAKQSGGMIVYIPYSRRIIKPQDREWYDDIYIPFKDKPYSKYDIPNRNKKLVALCDVLLCYVYKPGGASKTMEYARRLNIPIINIATML